LQTLRRQIEKLEERLKGKEAAGIDLEPDSDEEETDSRE
jgi:hypothetical protein